jgi:transient receptor potential cation channel subfamily A protein 1
VSFAMGFYIMLHKDIPKDASNDKQDSEDEYPFFNKPWHALIKTTIMFVGEIEFGDLPIDLNSGLSFLFLLAFVFLIIVVLMNLLNGLAVSDTGLIREKAEIVSHIARVDTISYTESILLGDPLDFLGNWPAFKWIANLPSMALMRCLFKNKTLLHLIHKVYIGWTIKL